MLITRDNTFKIIIRKKCVFIIADKCEDIANNNVLITIKIKQTHKVFNIIQKN